MKHILVSHTACVLARLFAGSILAVSALPALAADAPKAPSVPVPSSGGAIRFDIVRFEVIGNTILPIKQVESLLTPFTGKNRDFGDVQRALEALEGAFHKKGFNVVQVELPEQELNQGVVRLKVVQTKIGKVGVQGNSFFDQANIRHSLPGLTEGETPNIHKVSASLRLANENPAKKVSLQLESGEKDDEVNAALKVVDEKPWKVGVSLDNTGTTATGKSHLGLMFQHANIAGLDHVLSLQYTTTLEKPSQVKVYGAGYHIPLYALGDSIDILGSYSNVDSGTVSTGLFDLQVSGKGKVFGTRYNHNLGHFGNYDPKLVYAFDYKAFLNNVELLGQPLGKDVTVHPLSVAYSGAWTLNNGDANFSIQALRNISGGKNGKSADFDAVRVGSAANYTILRYGANYNRTLPADWQLRLALVGQYTRDALIPGEQFGAGGAASVRGFIEREISNDYGFQTNIEVYTPNLCTGLKLFQTQCRALAFYDGAHMNRNDALAGEQTQATIGSIGFGWRMMMDKYFSMQMDYGHVINTGGIADKDKNHVHVKFGLSY